MHTAGSPRLASSPCSQREMPPISSPTVSMSPRWRSSQAATTSGAASTAPSRSTLPLAPTTQMATSLSDTSSPT